jgi:hypothetical protein
LKQFSEVSHGRSPTKSDHVVTDTSNEIQKTVPEAFLLLMAVVYLL